MGHHNSSASIRVFPRLNDPMFFALWPLREGFDDRVLHISEFIAFREVIEDVPVVLGKVKSQIAKEVLFVADAAVEREVVVQQDVVIDSNFCYLPECDLHLGDIFGLAGRNQLPELPYEGGLRGLSRSRNRVGKDGSACFESTVPQRLAVFLALRLFSLGKSLLQDTALVELGPDEVGDGRDLHHSPPSPLPHQLLEQFRVIPFLDVHVEVADVGRHLDSNPVQRSHALVQVQDQKTVFAVGVDVAEQGLLFDGTGNEEGPTRWSRGGGDSPPLLLDGFLQLSDDAGAFPKDLSGCRVVDGLLLKGTVESEESIEFGFAIDVLGLHAFDLEVVGLTTCPPPFDVSGSSSEDASLDLAAGLLEGS